ncbi:hypothetical protein HMPREF1633_14610 [Tissierellia bacterium S5-A11]|nr:hypothetical protein HMPREF1633_14610 [Tissierellia bacterium S5-A11]
MYSVVIEHFLYIHYTQVWLFVKLQKCYKTGSSGFGAVFYAFWGLVKGSQFFVLGGGVWCPVCIFWGLRGFWWFWKYFANIYIFGVAGRAITTFHQLKFAWAPFAVKDCI